MDVERRLFQSAAVWFLAGLATGLWLLSLYTGGQAAQFDRVKGLHVSLLVAGWLGMTAAAGLLAFVRRRRGRLRSEALAATAAVLWNVWCAGTALSFFVPIGALRSLLAALLPLALAALFLACWDGPAGWSLAALAAAGSAFLTFHGIQAALPALSGLEIAAAIAGSLVARYQWRLRWGWLALVWAAGIGLHSPWALAAAAGLPLLVAGVRSVPRSPGSAFLALSLGVDWLTASLRALTPLGVAASLSSAAFAAFYLAQPNVVDRRVARVHAVLHVGGFAALVTGMQLGQMALAWLGAFAVVAGAAVFMLYLAAPAAPRLADPAG